VLWVVIMVAIAVAGLAMVVGYARWLWHKASDVMSEVAVVSDRLGQLGTLLAQVQPLSPTRVPGAAGHQSEGAWADEEEDEDDDWSADARALRLAREAATGSVARHASEPDFRPTT
jgi:hypothetical protein